MDAAPGAGPGEAYNPTYVAVGQQLGKGAYGTVHLGVHEGTGAQVAVKEFASGVGGVAELTTELAMLEKLVHPRVVRVLGSHVGAEDGRALMYLEFMPGGSLATLMEKNHGRLWEGLVRRVALDATCGVSFLHGRGVVHRDIKPQNLLIGADGRVKVADFGCCRELAQSGTGTNTMGTPRYMAPEAVMGKAVFASDVWALAATVTELASFVPPWSDVVTSGGTIALLFHIGNVAERGDSPQSHPTIPEVLSPVVQEALRRCFAAAACDRPSCAELLETRFLEDVEVALPGAETIAAYNATRHEAPLPERAEHHVDVIHSISVGSTVDTAASAPEATTFGTTTDRSGETSTLRQPSSSSAMGLTESSTADTSVRAPGFIDQVMQVMGMRRKPAPVSDDIRRKRSPSPCSRPIVVPDQMSHIRASISRAHSTSSSSSGWPPEAAYPYMPPGPMQHEEPVLQKWRPATKAAPQPYVQPQLRDSLTSLQQIIEQRKKDGEGKSGFSLPVQMVQQKHAKMEEPPKAHTNKVKARRKK